MVIVNEKTYIKLHLDILRQFEQVPADIYLKLSSQKVVKIIDASSPYSHTLLDHHGSKGIQHFFVTEEQFETFSDKVACTLSEKLGKMNDSDLEEKVKMQQAAVQLIMGELSCAKKLSQETSQLLFNTLKSSIDEVKKEPALGVMLKAFMRKKDFRSSHSLFMSYICNLIALKMEWRSDQILQKIALSCMLHDINLEEKGLARIYSKQQIEKLHGNDQLQIINHCFNSVMVLSKLKNMPPDIEKILSCHHEVPEIGFPGIVSASSITEVAAVVAMGEEFATRVYGHEHDLDLLHELREEFARRYDVGNFARPLVALLTLFDDMQEYTGSDRDGSS